MKFKNGHDKQEMIRNAIKEDCSTAVEITNWLTEKGYRGLSAWKIGNYMRRVSGVGSVRYWRHNYYFLV